MADEQTLYEAVSTGYGAAWRKMDAAGMTPPSLEVFVQGMKEIHTSPLIYAEQLIAQHQERQNT